MNMIRSWDHITNVIRAPHLGGCPIVITLSVCLSVRQKTLKLAITFLHLEISLSYLGSLWQELSNGTINFELVTLTVTFDLHLKKFNISHNFFILGDRAFIFDMCDHYDKTFQTVQMYHKFWTCDLDSDLWPTFEKTLTLAITFILRDKAFIFHMCDPYDKTFPTVP